MQFRRRRMNANLINKNINSIPPGFSCKLSIHARIFHPNLVVISLNSCSHLNGPVQCIVFFDMIYSLSIDQNPMGHRANQMHRPEDSVHQRAPWLIENTPKTQQRTHQIHHKARKNSLAILTRVVLEMPLLPQ